MPLEHRDIFHDKVVIHMEEEIEEEIEVKHG
jgi:hypothetical protein